MLSPPVPSLSVILQISMRQVRFSLQTLMIIRLSIHIIIQAPRLGLCQVLPLVIPILMRTRIPMFGLVYLSFLPPCILTRSGQKIFQGIPNSHCGQGKCRQDNYSSTCLYYNRAAWDLWWEWKKCVTVWLSVLLNCWYLVYRSTWM